MKKKLTIVGLIINSIVSYGQDNIVSQGITDSIYSKEYIKVNKYRSQVNYPPFIGWSLDSKKMLFNGGKVIYSMKKHTSEIREYKESNQNFSSYLSPNHKYFLYQEDENGNEDYQLFLYNISANSSKPISKKGDKTYDPFWSSNNNKIAYKSNKESSDRVDLYIQDISVNNKEILIFKDFSDDGQVYDWSSSNNQILAVKVISENDKLLYLINDNSYEIEQVNPSKTKIAYSNAKFIPNKNACLIVSDEFSEFLQLHYYDLIKKEFTNITADIQWDVESITIDKEGQKAAFTVNENGFSQLYILDILTLKYLKVNDFPEGIVRDLIINPKGTKVGFNFYSSTFRRKIYDYNIKKSTLNHYTRKGKPQVDSINFVEAESFTFKSIDIKTNKEYNIPAFIYKSKKESSPVFIDIHGGPEYQIRASFNGFYQYLVNELGITVIVPNIRGSNGYGKSYMKMDDGLNRENAIQDVGALLDWVKSQNNLDENRVAIHGESYGGYVVLSSLSKFPNRIKCGIDIVGISNWITYLNNTSDYRRDLRRVEFGDERNNETYQYLKKISPVNNANKINSPLLIFQGLNDPRVNYQGAEQMYESLNKQEKEVWYVLAKDEGHGFHKYANHLLQRNLTISFLKKHLSIE
ncbi:alpha/beta fold hydrolase [uncultured Aquimarina sp.]|uniref:S9 family peptidase n=1 Tax=uncultured Aquimarina sp. TaxID=575652 RepID=UPI00262C7B42|nr:alpha/beta fold hydrolase [uncultured Aquimarina sp.]